VGIATGYGLDGPGIEYELGSVMIWRLVTGWTVLGSNVGWVAL